VHGDQSRTGPQRRDVAASHRCADIPAHNSTRTAALPSRRPLG